MAGKSLYFPARFYVPDLDGLVPTAGNEPTAVGTECDAGDNISMAGQGMNFTSGAEVPDLDGLIRAGGGEPAAV